MSHVADSPKSRHFEPFSGRFTPIRPTIRAASGRGYALLGTRSTWVLHRPPGHCSPASRPTPHAGTSGVRPCADPPAGLLHATNRRIDKGRTGPDLNERRVYIQYVTEPGNSYGKINPFLPDSPPPNR